MPGEVPKFLHTLRDIWGTERYRNIESDIQTRGRIAVSLYIHMHMPRYIHVTIHMHVQIARMMYI